MSAKVILFDWGDTLMIDFSDSDGKMCEWKTVAEVDGATQTLSNLRQRGYQIYLATGADDSTEGEIVNALERVKLAEYFSGIFCQSNLGIPKGTAEFFTQICAALNIDKLNVIMVGDSLERDIEPAITAGIKAIWFNPKALKTPNKPCISISKLTELLSVLN